jgi:hypothetical protein
MPRDYFLKYGGTTFQNNVTPERIHHFVREMPQEQKQSVRDVVQLLENQGYISRQETYVKSRLE